VELEVGVENPDMAKTQRGKGKGKIFMMAFSFAYFLESLSPG
jgi:hypothetical protein